MDNLGKYNEIFKNNFQLTEDQFKDLSYQSVSVWDSIGHMSLIAALEDEFDILFDAEDIIDFSSYNRGKEILKKYNIDL